MLAFSIRSLDHSTSVLRSSDLRNCSLNWSFCPWKENLAWGVSSVAGLAGGEVTSGLTWLPVQKLLDSSPGWWWLFRWMKPGYKDILDVCSFMNVGFITELLFQVGHTVSGAPEPLWCCEAARPMSCTELADQTSWSTLVTSSVQSNIIMLEELPEEKHCCC